MKKIELLLLALALVALAMDLFLTGGSGIMVLMSWFTLAFFYMILSVAFFNNIKPKDIANGDAYKGIHIIRIVGAILTGLAIAITITGIMFRYFSWPGAAMDLYIGIIGLVIAGIVGWTRYAKAGSPFYKKIFSRVILFGALGIITLLLPQNTFLEIKYHKYPDYVRAVENAGKDPSNRALQDTLKQEEQKMHGAETH